MADKLFMYSWYHGTIGRAASENILLGKRPGLFLVRDSTSMAGGYVLAVSENARVSHYIITKSDGQYQIGEQTFDDLPQIVDFYKRHFLDTTTLVEAAARTVEFQQEEAPPVPPQNIESLRVRAKYNFPGNDPEDLQFKRGDILTIIRKREEQWWEAADATGREGMIPANYVEQIPTSTPSTRTSFPPNQPTREVGSIRNSQGGRGYTAPNQQQQQPNAEMAVPAIAEAIQDRFPTIYDPSELKFKKGDRILVLEKRDDGIWSGVLQNSKQGVFPFTYVNLISNSPQDIQAFQNSISNG